MDEAVVGLVSHISIAARIAFLTFVLGSASLGTLSVSAAKPETILTPSSGPDFYLGATRPDVVSADGTFSESIITVSSGNNFDGRVDLSYLSSSDLNCLPLSNLAIMGSGKSSLSCSSTTAGSYNITIAGKSGSIVHESTVTFAFTPIPVTMIPDIRLAMSNATISFSSGASGTDTITASPLNGFSGTVRFSAQTPGGVSCSFNPISVQTSGTATLTCNSNTEGDYIVTLKATLEGGQAHSKNVTVHVAAVSPVSPAPSTGLNPAILYAVIGAVIVAVVASLLLVVRPRRRGPKIAS